MYNCLKVLKLFIWFYWRWF